ncbi:MAG: hypothetical protein GWO24_09770, partial [Akkermansiaceae bacterium]|nr:hypothetical protein [Akkermansiaceae bacterium]
MDDDPKHAPDCTRTHTRKMNTNTTMAAHNLMSTGRITGILTALGVAIGFVPVLAADLAVKEGQKIAFMGDSITQAGARPNGYVSLVIRGLEAAG